MSAHALHCPSCVVTEHFIVQLLSCPGAGWALASLNDRMPDSTTAICSSSYTSSSHLVFADLLACISCYWFLCTSCLTGKASAFCFLPSRGNELYFAQDATWHLQDSHRNNARPWLAVVQHPTLKIVGTDKPLPVPACAVYTQRAVSKGKELRLEWGEDMWAALQQIDVSAVCLLSYTALFQCAHGMQPHCERRRKAQEGISSWG